MSKRPDYVGNLINNFRGHTGGLTYNPTDAREQMIETMYRRKLTETALARFTWEDMPESIDLRFLEWALFYNGLVVVHLDERYGAIIANRARPEGNFNMYDNPRYFWAYGSNYPGKRIRQDECAPIWATITRFGTDNDIVNLYAHKLAELDRTIEINAKNTRRTKAIALEDEEQLSVDNIINALDRGDPVIKVTNSGVLDRIERTLDFGVSPKDVIDLSVLRARVMNECMGMLGIDNANQDKKERLVAAEVDANAEQVDIGKTANLIPRQQGVELINRRFGELYGFEAKVRYSSDLSDDEKEALEDADIHNDTGAGEGESDLRTGVGQSSDELSSLS